MLAKDTSTASEAGTIKIKRTRMIAQNPSSKTQKRKKNKESHMKNNTKALRK